MTEYIRVSPADVPYLSKLATEIVREHFDPLIGVAQNDYMLAKFQSQEAIFGQLDAGYRYYWVRTEGENAGFLAFYPRGNVMYLSKFYIHKNYRGRHIARGMLQFIVEETKKENLPAIILNVNKGNTEVISKYCHLGFEIIREKKNDIGNGFFMDDYVLEKRLDEIDPV